MKMEEEIENFNTKDVVVAICAFLKYGEDTFNPNKKRKEPGHKGYFSGDGWAARCLRYHKEQLEKSINTKTEENERLVQNNSIPQKG